MTLEELGMDPENEGIISDLLRFVRDKEEFFKKAGKDWKRGYLFCDSPGTDRSSLIAAMANFLEFDIYHLDLTGLTSISELTNVLGSIRNRFLIVIQDFDQWARKLPDFKTELTLSGLSKIIHGLLSSCGDEQILVLTTSHNHIKSVDATLLRPLNIDLYIHTSSPQPKAVPDGGEIALLDSSEQIPSVDFYATNNRAYQSDILESNSVREASRRQCMPEHVLSLVDSTARSTDFDASDNSAHLVRVYQSGPIVFNSEKKDTGEGLNIECSTKSVLSFDDSSKQISLSDVAVTEEKSHLVRAYQSGPGGRRDVAAKSICAIYDPGSHTTDSLALPSLEVLETLLIQEQPNDCVPLLSMGRLTLQGCVQREKSQIIGVEQRVNKWPRYLGGLTTESASSSRFPIGLPDGGHSHIVLLDQLDQSAKYIEHAARADQCSPTLSLGEKKMVRKTLKRKCRTMSVILKDNHQQFARICEAAAKSLGATWTFTKHGINQVSTVKRIKRHGIHQWPSFRQKWATRKGCSLGEESPFKVSCLSMDEKLDSRLRLIHMSQFARSSPWAFALQDGGEIVRPTALSSSELAATNNREHLVGQDQTGSTASHYESDNTSETSNNQGLEDLGQHFGCKHKHALKSLGVSGSMFKSTRRQHWFYWWQVRFENNDSHSWKSFEVQDSLFLGEQFNSIRHLAQRRTLTHKLCVRLKKSQDLPRSLQKSHSGGLAAQSATGLPDGGHILSLSKNKIVRKTLKRKCGTMSVLSLEEHQQPVGRRWEDAAKFFGAKHTCRQLAIHRESTAKRICRQYGTQQWPFKQSAIGLLDGRHILSLSKKKTVRRTLKRKCRTMSVLSLKYHQHLDSRWEDAVKSLGAKHIRRQLVIHRVSTTKRIHRQHGMHQWTFEQNWATMKGQSLGDESPFEVMSLSEDGKLVSRLQRIHVSWLGIFAPWPSALPGGGQIVGPIALSSGEFASTNNKAQRVGQDKRSFDASDSKKKRTREQEDHEEINTSITLDDLRQHYGRKRKDVAESLGVSVSTLKRTCRQHGIKRWPNIIRKKAGRPPDQYGENNPSPTWKTLSTNGQTVLENQMVSHLEETNEFLRDFVEGSNEGRVSSEWAFQLKNQWTVSNSYPNSNGPEVPHPHIASTQILGENMGSLGDGRNSFGSLEEHLPQKRHISGSMWTVPPCSALSQHMPTIPLTMGSSVDRINSLAFLEDVFLEEDVSESISWTIPSCSEPAPSQLMPTVPRTTGSLDGLRNLLPSLEESFSAGRAFGFINRTVPSCSYPVSSQTMSTVPHTTGSSDDLRNLIAIEEEPFWAGHVSESINLPVPSCFDPASSQSMPTILHTMPPNLRMMSLLTEMQDTMSVNLKATYGATAIKFQFPLTSGINELKEEVSKTLECELGSFRVEYKDEEGEWILMARDENVREYLRLVTSLGNQVTKLKVHDKVPNTTNFCGNCECVNCWSLKQKRP